MNWDIWDFLAASLLLGGGALAIFAARAWLPRGTPRRLAILAVPLCVAVIWVQLAVGIFN